MAHHQRAVTIAVALNTGIFIVEAVAGYQASSLTLVMDSVHNLSDEMALIALGWPLSSRVARPKHCCAEPMCSTRWACSR